MDWFDIVDRLIHPDTKISRVLAYIVVIIAISFFLNDLFRFTAHYRINSKIETLQHYNKLLSDTTFTGDEIAQIKKQRLKMINDESMIIRAIYFVKNSIIRNDNTTINETTKTTNITTIKAEKKKTNSSERKLFWHVVTSNVFIIGFMIFVLVMFITDSNIDADITNISRLILLNFGFAVLMFIFSWLTSLIPIIYNNVNYNYLVNFGISTIIGGIVIYFLGREQKKTT